MHGCCLTERVDCDRSCHLSKPSDILVWFRLMLISCAEDLHGSSSLQKLLVSHWHKVHRPSFKRIKFCEQINKVEFSCSNFYKSMTVRATRRCFIISEMRVQLWLRSAFHFSVETVISTEIQQMIKGRFPNSGLCRSGCLQPLLLPERPVWRESSRWEPWRRTQQVTLCVLMVYCYFNLFVIVVVVDKRKNIRTV